MNDFITVCQDRATGNSTCVGTGAALREIFIRAGFAELVAHFPSDQTVCELTLHRDFIRGLEANAWKRIAHSIDTFNKLHRNDA